MIVYLITGCLGVRGVGFALNAAATFDFAPASHEVPSPPGFLVLNSRPLGIVVWHRNIKNRLIGCHAWVGLDLVWIIHLRKAGVLLPRCDPLSIFSPGFAERSSHKSSTPSDRPSIRNKIRQFLGNLPRQTALGLIGAAKL